MKPFVKWAGGKRQLLPELLKRIPEDYKNYYEPFVGGGALLFELCPEWAIINDKNKYLINAYRQIRDNPRDVIRRLEIIDKGQSKPYDEYYYNCRSKYNHKIKNNICDVEAAALLIYLNKHCFNGVYRVNQKGFFNVPYNGTYGASYDAENIMSCAEYLKDVAIIDMDFRDACLTAGKKDFVYLDSPYAPLNTTTFQNYVVGGFGEKEHKRLAKVFKELTIRGCYCMLSNHNTDIIRELYKDFYIEEVDVSRSINSDGKNRKGKEVIIRNYQ